MTKGDILIVGPWQLTPAPYVLTAYGPCNTCTAWLVTLPVAEAEGPAMLVLLGALANAGVTHKLTA